MRQLDEGPCCGRSTSVAAPSHALEYSPAGRCVSLLGVLAMVVGVAAATAAHATNRGPGGVTEQMHRLGTFTLPGPSTTPKSPRPSQAPPHQPMNRSLRHTTAAPVPRVTGSPVTTSTDSSFTGFSGLNDYQQFNAGTGAYAGTQFDLEPPDQGLCVGAGHVVEAVNNAIQVFGTDGTPETAPAALSQVFKVTPEATPNPASPSGYTFGLFISDPKCYYDPGTGYFFLSELGLSVDPVTGALTGPAEQLVAVSNHQDPTTWTTYSFATTDDGSSGTPSDPGCPCFGDQPLIGADANGFYVTTNEYSTLGTGFNGAQLYAMSKTGLETGTNLTVTHLQPGLDPSITSTLGGVAFTIQPSTSPNGVYETAAGGTEYFLSALDFGAAPALGTRANSIAAWALTDTASLNTSSPSLSLQAVVLPSEEYTQPPNATQKMGQIPLGRAVHSPEEMVTANDDRLNQTVFADGQLWAGLNTTVKTQNGPTLTGLAWFDVTPSMSGGSLSATLTSQGYLAVNKEDLLFPSIGVTPSGNAVMAFSLVGPNYYPSAAYTDLNFGPDPGTVHIAAAGVAPDDGFSGYRAFGGAGAGRWGDYSAAAATPTGTVWFASEYISGGHRTMFANWATFVAQVTP